MLKKAESVLNNDLAPITSIIEKFEDENGDNNSQVDPSQAYTNLLLEPTEHELQLKQQVESSTKLSED